MLSFYDLKPVSVFFCYIIDHIPQMNNLQLRETFPNDSSLFRSRLPNSESCVHFYSACQLTPALLTRLSQIVATDIFLSFVWHNGETISWVAQTTDVYLPDLETVKTRMLELWFLVRDFLVAGGCLLIVLEKQSDPPPLLQLFLILFLFLLLFFSFLPFSSLLPLLPPPCLQPFLPYFLRI